jgi:hypothetical protein
MLYPRVVRTAFPRFKIALLGLIQTKPLRGYERPLAMSGPGLNLKEAS